MAIQSIISFPKHAFARCAGGLWLASSIVVLLVGCASQARHEADNGVPETPIVDAPEQKNPPGDTGGLETDLLLDLLVASIARQRNQGQVALESLSRAAYQSREPRIIADAIQLAAQLEEYQQLTDLARLFNTIEPGNYRVLIALAEGQFRLGKHAAAVATVTELARAQSRDGAHIMQAIAVMLARQEDPALLPELARIGAREPASIGVLMTATILAASQKHTEEFTRLVDKVLALAPDWEVPANLKLTYYASIEHPARHTFAVAHLAAHPTHEAFRLQYARILVQEDDLDAALVQLEAQLQRNPDSAAALFTAGVIYLDKNETDAARRLLEKYVANHGSDRDQARIYLADIAYDASDFELAARYLNAVNDQAYYFEAQTKLARVLARTDSVEAGLRHLAQIDAFSAEEKTRLILESEQLLQDAGRLEEALMVLNDGLQRLPDNPELLYSRGILAAIMNQLDLHEQDMRQLILLQPDNAHAYNALGYTLADKTERLDEALMLIVRANELLPDNPFILDSLGWVHFRLGNYEQAIKWLRQAMAGRPDAEIAAHLGEVLWQLGEKEEAREIWKRGTELAPDNKVLEDTIKRLNHRSSGLYRMPCCDQLVSGGQAARPYSAFH